MMIMRTIKRYRRSRIALLVGWVAVVATMHVGAQELVETKDYFYNVNANYLGLAYNLVYLNLDNYTEPAFAKPDITIPPVVFALKRGPETITAINGKTFHLPNGVRGYPGNNKSTFESDVEEYTSGNTYRQSMERTLELSVGVADTFSISGSAAFKSVLETTKNSRNRMWRQTGYVEGHRLKIDLDNPKALTFSKDFKRAVAELGSSESYDAFIEKWGTHFASTITYGGKAYLTATLSQEDVKESKLTADKFEAAVSGTFKKVTASVSGSQARENEETHTSGMFHEKIEASAYGGNGNVFTRDAPGSFNDWAATVRDNPGIYAIELTCYDQLLTKSFFPEDHAIVNKQKELRRRIVTYLKEHRVDAPESGNFYPSKPKITPLEGIYTIQQKLNHRYVDAYSDSKHDYGLVTRNWQNDNSQKWIIKPVEGAPNTYTIQQKANSRYVDAHTAKSQDYRLVTRHAQKDDSQKWIIKPIEGDPDTYTIQQKSNHRYVDAHSDSKQDYRLVTRDKQNDASQKWLITEAQ
ncbi:MAC/perforin domain-containing protein [candidate division CSSED10-310 bacterium]|uniref:MAC/perforin domain-containing protein n=1 Tax=candidate division CSSED10-310 bacterium TaxID=2855610 RepID=A0ABV6Z5H5_UNCC1